MERRGCVREPDSMSQPARGGAKERGQAIRYFQGGNLGSVEASQSQQGSGRGRRANDCGFRKEPEREPVQDLESDVVGPLLSAAGADGEDSESQRRGKEAGHTDGVGSDRARGGEVETGAGGGPAVPSGFLRVSTGEVGLGGGGASAAAMLAL